MSVKQDITSPRTAADIERKYNFGKSYSELMGIASDARRTAQEAKQIAQEMSVSNGGLSAVFKLSIENSEDGGRQNVYSLINGKANKIHFEADSLQINSTNFRLAEDGTVYIKAGNIGNCSFDGEGNLIVPINFISGSIASSNIDTKGLTATDVNITGTLKAEGAKSYFGNTRIVEDATVKDVITYDGIYLGTEGAYGDVFFGKVKNDIKRTAVLGLGVDNGGVMLTNSGLVTSDGTEWTWSRLFQAIIKAETNAATVASEE